MLKSFKNITIFVFDIDGVLTDGNLLVMANGVMLRKMNVRDGYALQLAIKKKYEIIIISGSYSAEAQIRLEKLGVNKIFMRVENKLKKLKELIALHQLNKEEILYMGDDIPDYEVMQFCGLATCPADATAEIKSISKYISPLKGGEGCVRDVIEKVLKLQNNWMVDTSIPSK
jgi:3-deoxy-D-manno-octulosonate 8-phosphate phosphatase (KDO 8-P phosphatase)